GFSKIHVFSFSPRRGTPAADLPQRVPPAVLDERRKRLHELERRLADAYARSLIGRRLDVLVESADPDYPGHVRGTSCRYVPASFEGRAEVLRRQRVPVVAVSVANGVVLARPDAELGPANADDLRRLPLPVVT